MKTITAKLGTMRKAVEWVVYPPDSDPDEIVIQSDKRIACFNVKTGKGLLSKSCSSGAYFLHLNPVLGATHIVVPQDVILAAVAARSKRGDQIGPGVYA